MITGTLIKNHADTVDLRSERKISKRQKDAATAALLKKLMKMFTGEFSHYNPQSAVADAGTDPAVSQVLADFFAQQQGLRRYGGRCELATARDWNWKEKPSIISMVV